MTEDKNVEKVTLQIFYIAYIISSLAGLLIANSFELVTFLVQILTAVISITFLILTMVLRKYAIIQHISFGFYLFIVLTGMWIGLGSANILVIIFSIAISQVIILTLKGKIRLMYLGAVIGYSMIFIIYDMLFRFDDPTKVVYTVGSLVGVSVLLSGVFLILLTSKIYTEQLVNRLKINSYYDMLTGVKNSRAFYSEVEKFESDYTRYQINYILVYLDIDNYKEINDLYGHQVGDKVLQAFTDFIRTQIRKGDDIYRIGGDEFVIVLRKIDEGYSKNKVESIVFNLAQTKLAEHEISFSYGLASRQNYADNFDEEDLNLMMKKADENMYKYKQSKGKTLLK